MEINNITEKTPLVSVVVPVFNVEKYLRECIESIQHQTLKDIEIIIVNDGSTDNSLNIINEYAALDDRIVVIDKPNGGYATAVNAGLDAATGEYVAEVDSDDYIAPEMYQTLYDAAKVSESDVVISNYIEFTGKNETFQAFPMKQVPDDYYETLLSPSELFAENRTELFGLIVIWSSIYRRDFIEANRIRVNEQVFCYNDTGFWFRTRSLAKNIYFIDKELYYYRNDVQGQTIKKFNERYYIAINEYLDTKQDFENRGVWSNAKALWINRFLKNCYYFVLPRLEDETIAKFIKLIKPILKNIFIDKDFISENEKTLGEDVLRKSRSILVNADKFIKDYIEGRCKISVVVPVYNGAKHIKHTIPKIINQEFRDFELILVNDASKDNSIEILRTFERDPRVKLVDLPKNKGQSMARNIGLKMAKGKYIIFLDCDDHFHHKLLGDFWWHMNAYQLDVCLAGYSVFNCRENKVTYTNLYQFLPDGEFSGRSLSAEQLKGIAGWNWDKMYRREFLIDNNIIFPENLRVSEDAMVAYPAILLADKIFAMKWNLITYNEFGASSVSSKMGDYIEDNFKYYDTLYDFLSNHYMHKTHRRHFINLFVQHVGFSYENLIKKDSMKEKFFDLLVGEYLEKFAITQYIPDSYFVDDDTREKFYLLRRMMNYTVGQYKKFIDDLDVIPLEVDYYKPGYEFKHENIIVLKPNITQVIDSDKPSVINNGFGEKPKAQNLISLIIKILFKPELRTRVYEFLMKNI